MKLAPRPAPRPAGRAARRRLLASLPTALTVAALVVACGNHAPDPAPDPDAGAPGVDGVGAPLPAPAEASAVLVRGRITPDTLVLDPVLETPGATATPPSADGAHRILGSDDGGAPLFDVRFDAVAVADLPAGPEAHFQVVVGLDADRLRDLAAVELQTADGRRTARRASRSADQLAAEVAADTALRAERLGPDQVRVRWDARRYPLVQVQDPETGRTLGFGRGGEATMVTTADAVVVVLSEGVRSAARRLGVQDR